MTENFKKCALRIKEVVALAQAAAVVGWDQETMMPENASAARAEQMAALAGVIHEKHVDPINGELLRALSSEFNSLSEEEQVCVREWTRDYEKATKLPQDLVCEMARTASLSQEAWIKARKNSDFNSFAPWLEKTLILKRREAEIMGFKDNPYDALLDDYEPYMTAKELDPVFAEFKKGLLPLVAAIFESGTKINNKFLKRKYPEAKQEQLARSIMDILGLVKGSCRLDRSAHPFCSGIAPTDVRITTRYDENWFPQALYGVIHESGHALYEQGLEVKHMGTPLAEAVSLGIHESQSRLWENIIGRSREFIGFIYPKLKKLFPSQLKGINAESFYRAINHVEQSFIRVEADEVTYSLHILLRYEIEKSLIEGEIKVSELPSIWNEKMKHYLGVVPKNDAEGVLQDTHWAQGLIGYFPTYLLGNLYAAQWWNKIGKDVNGRDKQISEGNLKPTLTWLRKNIHSNGRRYSASALVQKATGEPLNAQYFINYLQKKYGELYKI